MTRTVAEYVVLALAVRDAARKGEPGAEAAWYDLRIEMEQDGVISAVLHKVVLAIWTRSSGPTHVHVSPREGQEGEQ